jgi:phthalate 4,5-dioxygenase oxygenase subunit
VTQQSHQRWPYRVSEGAVPHRGASLLLARIEDDALRCIYHGWLIDASGRVVEAPTQTIRPERFCAGLPVAHFPVHAQAGIAWVLLGGGETPPFADLPFNDRYGFEMITTTSVVPANWLQGLEGGMDSVHAPVLHRSVIEATLEQKDDSETAGVRATFAAPPRYETEETAFGLRQASLRPAGDDRTYLRLANYFFPFVIVVPNGYGSAVHAELRSLEQLLPKRHRGGRRGAGEHGAHRRSNEGESVVERRRHRPHPAAHPGRHRRV